MNLLLVNLILELSESVHFLSFLGRVAPLRCTLAITLGSMLLGCLALVPHFSWHDGLGLDKSVLLGTVLGKGGVVLLAAATWLLG